MKQNTIECGLSSVHLDFVLASDEKCGPGILSYYDRSLQNIKAFSGMLSISCEKVRAWGDSMHIYYLGREECYQTVISPIISGKEKFYHAISIRKDMNVMENGYCTLLMEEGREGEIFYDFLMGHYDLPLLREWAMPLFNYFLKGNHISSEKHLISNTNAFTNAIPIAGRQVSLRNIYACAISITEEDLKKAVSLLLRERVICISKRPQRKLDFADMDSYFEKYGAKLVKNLEGLMRPLVPLDGVAHNFTLRDMRLYPQQIAVVNGVTALLDRSNYAILNHGMGTGKTITASAICDSYYTNKWLRAHQGKTLSDSLEKGNVNYRCVIMCPGHLVQKWSDEIHSQVPFAKVTIINSLEQLVKLRDAGRQRRGKEFLVMSKDFSKLTYQEIPVPKKRRRHRLFLKVCECGNEFATRGTECPKCGRSKYGLQDTGDMATGMTCPFCNKILLANKLQPALMPGYSGEAEVQVLDYDGFLARKNENSHCYYCGERLWQPRVSNIGAEGKEPIWMRVTHYANKAHKGKKTVWMHQEYAMEFYARIGEMPLNFSISQGGRKYSPAEFIKRYMKGYFDVAIFDEAHLYKGGATGQGHAMHALVKASKKQLALTGTIAGGYASHLFYLLWRLHPQRMKERGYDFYGEMEFIKEYGKLEAEYAYHDDNYDGNYNFCSKGKQLRQPKVKPGISPKIFMDFLLDHTTFLDLADMSRYLPKLKEQVVLVPPSEEDGEVVCEYREVAHSLAQYVRDRNQGGRGLLSQMLQFSLSYPDKPYGVDPIASTKTGAILCTPKNFERYKDISQFGNLLSKEQKLVQLVSGEISQGRNCFVYAEFTASPERCISYRLKEILEVHAGLKGKVAVLESSSPETAKRESWMHERASEGIKVFITNPKCVETGLDFCFSHRGKDYNFPTLIFYQTGYSLFTIWQASRRAYRLSQKEECRTYYMALEGTIQPAVLKLIAEKQAATSAIQGKFSAEGLASMANGTDARMEIARALCSMDLETKNGLQDMFDVIACEEEDEYSDYEPMPLLRELIDGQVDAEESEQEKIMPFIVGTMQFLRMEDTIDPYKEETVAAYRKRKKMMPVAGQLSLFS